MISWISAWNTTLWHVRQSKRITAHLKESLWNENVNYTWLNLKQACPQRALVFCSDLPTHSALSFSLLVVLTSPPPPRMVMSQGTSDSSSGGRGELPGQAGAGHSQTTERRGQWSAGAGQEHHQAAPAATTSGKEGHRVPRLQVCSGDQSQCLSGLVCEEL